MPRSTLKSLLGLGLSTLSHALPSLHPRQDTTAAVSKLLLGRPNTILAANFEGSTLTIVAKNTIPGTSASWLLFREGTNHLYAIDENSDKTRLFTFDLAANAQ